MEALKVSNGLLIHVESISQILSTEATEEIVARSLLLLMTTLATALALLLLASLSSWASTLQLKFIFWVSGKVEVLHMHTKTAI